MPNNSFTEDNRPQNRFGPIRSQRARARTDSITQRSPALTAKVDARRRIFRRLCARYTPRRELDVNCPLSGSKRVVVPAGARMEVDERARDERGERETNERRAG